MKKKIIMNFRAFVVAKELKETDAKFLAFYSVQKSIPYLQKTLLPFFTVKILQFKNVSACIWHGSRKFKCLIIPYDVGTHKN